MPPIKLDQLNLNLLRTLDVLLHSLDLNLTAERLLVTRSSVSHSLRQLRDHLRDPLIVRGAQGAQLTPFAEGLRAPLRAHLTGLEQLLNAERTFDPTRSTRRFSVISLDAFHAHLYPALLKRLAALGSPLRLRQVSTCASPLTQALAEEHDFYVGPRANLPAELEAEELLAFDYVLVAHSKHLRARAPEALARGELSEDEYVSLRHAVVTCPSTGPSLIEQRLDALSLTRDVVIETDSFSSLIYLLHTGECSYATPRSLIAPLLALSEQLVTVELPPRLNGVTRLSLAWHRAKSADPGHSWLRALLIAEARALWGGAQVRAGQ